MRIIGGEARGRRIVAPDGEQTRPTADKTREALFSILMRDVPGASVLDLFGGTGALALEAMSRGAKSAVICDISPKAAQAIQSNIQSVMQGRSGVRFIRADYKKALDTLSSESFDLVFLDPPYRLSEAYAYCVRRLIAGGMLAEDGIIVAERAASVRVEWPPDAAVYDTRTYRDTCLDFIRAEASV